MGKVQHWRGFRRNFGLGAAPVLDSSNDVKNLDITRSRHRQPVTDLLKGCAARIQIMSRDAPGHVVGNYNNKGCCD